MSYISLALLVTTLTTQVSNRFLRLCVNFPKGNAIFLEQNIERHICIVFHQSVLFCIRDSTPAHIFFRPVIWECELCVSLRFLLLIVTTQSCRHLETLTSYYKVITQIIVGCVYFLPFESLFCHRIALNPDYLPLASLSLPSDICTLQSRQAPVSRSHIIWDIRSWYLCGMVH